METAFAAICAAILGGNVIASDDATMACFRKEQPTMTAAGEWSQRGIGKEFTIFANNAEQLGIDLGSQEAPVDETTDETTDQ